MKIAVILSRTLAVSVMISSEARETSTSATHAVTGSETESKSTLI